MPEKSAFKPEEILSLTKGFGTQAPKAARNAIPPGDYEVNTTLHIEGTIHVGEDHERKPTVSLPLKEILALFVARSGITREASLKLLRECITDALKQSSQGKGAIDALGIVEPIFKAEVEALLSDLPKTKVKGKVTTELEISKCA